MRGGLLTMQTIEIKMLPRNASENMEKMEHIANIVNRVYAIAEEGLYKQGEVRTTVEEMIEFTSKGEIAVARYNRKIVGCIRMRQMDQKTGEFGMLAVDVKYQGFGIGRELIYYAEQKYKNKQLHKMQLELLVPVEGTHPTKVALENWYVRIGYEPVYTETTDALFPKLAQMLAVPCKFIVFQKNLIG